LNGKINEPRATGAAVGRATDGHVDEVGAAAAVAVAAPNGKPNQAGASNRMRLRPQRRIARRLRPQYLQDKAHDLEMKWSELTTGEVLQN
jgi:hypothetical protein